MVTEDGTITAMSGIVERHPVFKTDAHRVRVEIPLKPEQRELAERIHRGDVPGEIRGFLRSAIAQLIGGDTFHPEVTQIERIDSDFLVMDTSITVLKKDSADRVFEVLQAATGTDYPPVIGRAGIFPMESRVGLSEVKELMHCGDLAASGYKFLPSGAITFPLRPLRYTFADWLMEKESLEKLFGRESARAMIKSGRSESPCPDELLPRDLLVCGIDIHTRNHHVVLDRELLTADGQPSASYQLEASLLEAGRTQGLDRQAEVVNMNGGPIPLSSLRLRATVYRALQTVEPGV